MKYCIQFRDQKYPIAEEEIPKVIQAMDQKGIVILKAGVFHGAFISAIVKDIHAERGWNYGYRPRGDDNLTRAAYVTELPERITDDYKLLPPSEASQLPTPYKD